MSTGAARAGRSARLAACLDRARAGDHSALSVVVRELDPLLWHVARSQGLDREDAADVVQAVWLELVRRLGDIRTPGALTSWLITTTRREAWRVRERGRRRPRGDPEAIAAVPDPGPDTDEGLIRDERDRTLWRAFGRLTERCQRLLRLVAQVDRPDYAAITEALGMPHGSIGPTRGRCLATLRDYLLEDPEWSDP